MQFRILGPVTVRSTNGDLLPITRPRQRNALCIFLLNSGRHLSREYFIDALWGVDSPNDPGGALRSNLYGLRKALGAKGRLRTDHNGYILTLHEGDVLDLQLFQNLTQQARKARESDDVESASRLLQLALDMWDDPQLADFPATPIIRPLISELLEHRHAAQESLVDARLALGQHHELLPFLMSLTAAQPLRERRWEQLMLALYRCGRQAEALDTFTRARAILTEEYGIDPGSALRNLQQFILADDRMQDPPPPVPPHRDRFAAAHGPTALQPPASVPRQLPAPPRHLIGRKAELKTLTDLANEVSPTGSSPVVSMICGGPGTGKTALALHFAHQVADRFPDGQLYIDLGAYGSVADSVSTQRAIRSVLAPLIQLPQPSTTAPHAEANLYRTILAKRQLLVLIDNAHSSAQVRPLIPAAPQCMVIITSRLKLTGLVTSHGGHLTTLGVLSLAEAKGLLASRLTANHLAVDNAALSEVSELCARLPLALVMAATRAVARPKVPLRDLAEELRPEQNRLNALWGDQPQGGIREAFSWSYERLTSAEAQMFRVLGAHRIQDITAADAGRLAKIPVAHALQALLGLEYAHLMRECAPGRYQFGELIGAYAAEKSAEDARAAPTALPVGFSPKAMVW